MLDSGESGDQNHNILPFPSPFLLVEACNGCIHNISEQISDLITPSTNQPLCVRAVVSNWHITDIL
jgi:hypothetical protein